MNSSQKSNAPIEEERFASSQWSVFGVPHIQHWAEKYEHFSRAQPIEAMSMKSEHLRAIARLRLQRSRHDSASAGCTSQRDVVLSADAAFMAYAACTHPVRSDLVAAQGKALATAITTCLDHHPTLRTPKRLLTRLGLQGVTTSAAIESLQVLVSDLETNTGFVGPTVAAAIAGALRDAVKLVPRRQFVGIIEDIAPAVSAITTVATSALFPGGSGVVAPGTGPTTSASRWHREAQCPAFWIEYAPIFRCFLCIPSQGVSIGLNRSQLRTLMALLIGDQALRARRYSGITITPPTNTRSAVLHIVRSVALALPLRKYLALQRLCLMLQSDREFNAWMDFRAAMFGDL